MKCSMDRLCALTVAIGDSLDTALEDVVGLGGSAPAALMSIQQEPGLTVDELAVTMGITGSGAVRLVDRLRDAGLVERRPGTDGRTRHLHVTEKGNLVAENAFSARSAEMERIAAPLDDEEREVLGRLVGVLLGEAVHDRAGAERACRFCRYGDCPDDTCPLGHFHASSGSDKDRGERSIAASG